MFAINGGQEKTSSRFQETGVQKHGFEVSELAVFLLDIEKMFIACVLSIIGWTCWLAIAKHKTSDDYETVFVVCYPKEN